MLGRPELASVRTFEYSTLNRGKRQIRLLKLERRTPFLYISANLITCDMDNPIPYEAISYVWGPPTAKERPVLLDNSLIHLTTTVHSILLRRSSLFTTRYLWIDSLCINQSDTQEKTSQVRLMTEIYQTAYRVYIYLGESSKAWLASSFTSLLLSKQILSSTKFEAYIFALFARRDTVPILHAQLTAFIDLLHHPWFSRIWVVQEVAVANSPIILYGNQSFQWDYFNLLRHVFEDGTAAKVASLLRYRGEELIVGSMPRGPTHAGLMDESRRMWRVGYPVPLYILLRKFSAYKSTDPRDKVFALLGLTRSEILGDIVNYERSLGDVMVMVAQYFLQRAELLEVLQFAGMGMGGENERRDREIPSWVPDWSREKIPFTLSHGVQSSFPYRAGMYLRPHITTGSSTKSIYLKAKPIGTVSILGSVIQTSPTDKNSVSSNAQTFTTYIRETQLLVARHLLLVYQLTQQPRADVLWRTLIGDKTLTSRPAPESFAEAFNTVMQHGKAVGELHIDDLVDKEVHKVKKEALQQALSENKFYQGWKTWKEDMSTLSGAQ
jgi:hypothetical protein